MKKLFGSLPIKLILGMMLGLVLGMWAGNAFMQIIITVQEILGAFIFFCVPLIILGFITPSITKVGQSSSNLVVLALCLAYISSIGAAFMSMFAGFGIIPNLNISANITQARELPKAIFDLGVPPIMSVMSALVLSVVLGLAAAWNKATTTINLLEEFRKIVISIVVNIMIPALPFYIACTFCSLSYEGVITKQLPIFAIVVFIVMFGHYVWLALLYIIAGIYSKKNPFRVVRHYGSAYLTAVGTMSSAATLPVALNCARKSDALRGDMVDFGIPLFANIHLCGSVLTEVFFVMTVSQILYGTLPALGTMIVFCLILGIFAIGAPGVPGGTVMASLGLIISVLGFDNNGTALMLTIFALQDSFGTACNVTGDGALTLILTRFVEKHKL
ncbi:MAG: dicarboxylate/amino acid:cation symporter [Endomicrobium sp.]|nr:dicarboxylate/amino acid:cation symporter [Endomicrobium sp.]